MPVTEADAEQFGPGDGSGEVHEIPFPNLPGDQRSGSVPMAIRERPSIHREDRSEFSMISRRKTARPISVMNRVTARTHGLIIDAIALGCQSHRLIASL
jgi:hypothetical protein